MKGGSRLDERVLACGLAPSRSRAEALIRAGRVLVDDVPVDKPGARVKPEAAIRVRGQERRYVSRGGEKLAFALEDLGLDPRDMRCLDVGASTGGFSDCLLQAGATSVVAVDVGYGQLHEKLRQDSRVTSYERMNARELPDDLLSEAVDLVVADVSFISLRLVLPSIARVAPDADVLLMVKPQFEVGRERVGKGGVVRDDALREEAANDVSRAAAELGYRERRRVDSRLSGPKGNLEIFLWLRPNASAEAGSQAEANRQT